MATATDRGRVRTLTAARPVDLAHTLAPLRRGPGDPCRHRDAAGGHWHASRLRSGAVTYRLVQGDTHTVHATAWGPGAEEFLDDLPRMLCLDEDLSGFAPEHPLVRDAHRRFPGLRMLRTGRVFEALVPAVLEQKVHTRSARMSWRKLVCRYGEPAPGPAPAGLLLPPDADTWRRVPSWVFHRANVGPQRAQTIVRAAPVARPQERPPAPGPAAAPRPGETKPPQGGLYPPPLSPPPPTGPPPP
ncbi:DNA-3-methyladenine glycosylase family protein, partial [Nocardia farcinica]|uniref:DNA-3-methyladenine glycosylase family protein n=1 Tax=Nocardia farcinica TaxID=37329 RepID=UPI002458B597